MVDSINRSYKKTYQYNNIGRHKGQLSEGHPRLLPAAEILHLDGVRVTRQTERAQRFPVHNITVYNTSATLDFCFNVPNNHELDRQDLRKINSYTQHRFS